MSLSVQDAAIAFLLSQHNAIVAQNDEVQAEEVRREFAAARPVKGNKVTKDEVVVKGTVQTSTLVAPIQRAKVPGLDLGQKGVIDAKQFIMAIRRTMSRNEAMQLIQAYCGYDPKGDFGAQESAARTKAQRELGVAKVCATPPSVAVKAASRTVAGYVAGLPATPVERRLQDLQGRLTIAMDQWKEAKEAMDLCPNAQTIQAKQQAELNIKAVQLLIDEVSS